MQARKTAAVAGALALLLAAGGCARPSDDPPEASPTASTPEASEPAEEPPAEPTEQPTAEPTDAPTNAPAQGPAFLDPATVSEQEPGGEHLLTVTNVRAADNGAFDRVVFDLGGSGTPGWRVEYVDQALDDGSGDPIDVTGGAVLQVRISGTGMPMDTGVEEYAGAPVALSGTAIQEVVYRFVFEGYSTAFVGVAEQRPFRVFTLQDPLRLVVDVEH